MKNPCLACDLLYADKNNERCFRCSDRMTYVAQVDPENVTGIPRVSFCAAQVGSVRKLCRHVDPEDKRAAEDEFLDLCARLDADPETLRDTTNKKRDVSKMRRYILLSVIDKFNHIYYGDIAMLLGFSQQMARHAMVQDQTARAFVQTRGGGHV